MNFLRPTQSPMKLEVPHDIAPISHIKVNIFVIIIIKISLHILATSSMFSTIFNESSFFKSHVYHWGRRMKRLTIADG